MIQMFNVYKIYPNNHPALTDVSLHIKKGDFVFVTGPSGAGKTTLTKLTFFASMGVVFQDFKLLNNRTAYENVAFALEVIGTRRTEIKRKAWQVLKLVGLQNRLDATPLELSGGEQQRIAIARAIVNNPTILLADEPTGNLDAEITQDIMELFKGINERGTTVVIATHNKNLASKYSIKHIVLDKGRRIDTGN